MVYLDSGVANLFSIVLWSISVVIREVMKEVKKKDAYEYLMRFLVAPPDRKQIVWNSLGKHNGEVTSISSFLSFVPNSSYKRCQLRNEAGRPLQSFYIWGEQQECSGVQSNKVYHNGSLDCSVNEKVKTSK